MKKILACTLAALALVSCNEESPAAVETEIPTVEIVDNHSDEVEDNIGLFGGLSVEKVDEVQFVNKLNINDKAFPDIIAQSLYISILDHKLGQLDKFNAPSDKFVNQALGHIRTPSRNRNYTYTKNRIGFDQAASLDEGTQIPEGVMLSSMPLVKYRYKINDLIEADLIITKKLGYPGDDVSYTVFFVLTAVGSDGYITTTVTTNESNDINEAVYLSAFTNEPYNTLFVLSDLVDESYLTETAYEEVSKFEKRFDSYTLDVNKSVLTSQVGDMSFVYNSYFFSQQEASLSRKKMLSSISNGLGSDYEQKPAGDHFIYETDEGYKFLKYASSMDKVLSNYGSMDFYGSVGQVRSDQDVDLRLYCEMGQKKKYLVAAVGQTTIITEYKTSDKSKLFMYLFDLIGDEINRSL